MDGIKVSAFDRAKYRALLWLRDKLYERPAGYLLQEGATPPSMQRIQAFVGACPAGLLSPYEVYTDDGLYRNDDAIALILTLSSEHRLPWDTAAKLQTLLLEILPPGITYQVQLVRVADDGRYTCLLTASAPITADNRAALLRMRPVLEDMLVEAGIQAGAFEPDALITLMRQLFDAPSASSISYDDQALIKNQFGAARLSFESGRFGVQMGDRNLRWLKPYQVRAVSPDPQSRLQSLLPALLNKGGFVLSFNFKSASAGVLGQVTLLDIQRVGSQSSLHTVLARNGWLLEEDRFSAHLTLLSSLPAAIGPSLQAALKQTRRWRTWAEHEAGAMLPLPYMANQVTLAESAAPVRLRAEVSYG